MSEREVVFEVTCRVEGDRRDLDEAVEQLRDKLARLDPIFDFNNANGRHYRVRFWAVEEVPHAD